MSYESEQFKRKLKWVYICRAVGLPIRIALGIPAFIFLFLTGCMVDDVAKDIPGLFDWMRRG